jgi:hypothetical protein
MASTACSAADHDILHGSWDPNCNTYLKAETETVDDRDDKVAIPKSDNLMMVMRHMMLKLDTLQTDLNVMKRKNAESSSRLPQNLSAHKQRYGRNVLRGNKRTRCEPLYQLIHVHMK